MPIPTRGFARIVAYVLLVSVASRAAALRAHTGVRHRPHGHEHTPVPPAAALPLTAGAAS